MTTTSHCTSPVADTDVAIELDDVRKSFGAQKVHRGLNLKVPRGKITVIVGPSGVGKSVLLKYILGMVEPDSGHVRVEGRDIVTMKRRELREHRSKLGVLFQGAALFDSLDVYENVALPLREKTRLKEDEIRSKVLAKLTLMGMEHSLEKYPSELSGGMQKRVGLARALMIDPEIVLFDEPTTGLDPETTNNIYKLFKETQAKLGFTALIVSHDIPKIFKIADFVAFLHEGEIQAFIPPSGILGCPNDYVQKIVHLESGAWS